MAIGGNIEGFRCGHSRRHRRWHNEEYRRGLEREYGRTQKET